MPRTAKSSLRAGLSASIHVASVPLAYLAGANAAWAQGSGAERGLYVGTFGGIADVGGQDLRQLGTAYRRGDFALPGFRDFDLRVDVEGRITSRSAGNPLIGVQVGYSFDDGQSRFVPSVEIEAMYLSTRRQAALINPADEIVANVGKGAGQEMLADPRPLVGAEYGAGSHRFDDGMRMHTGLVMANAVFGYRVRRRVEPYVGAGVGLAVMVMRNATSYQTDPFGPIEQTQDTHEDVNHFNSDRNDTRVTFAYQTKVGLRVRITNRVSTFAEYRFIHMAATDFDFGATRYTGHAPTDRWSLHSGATGVHAGIAGLRLSF